MTDENIQEKNISEMWSAIEAVVVALSKQSNFDKMQFRGELTRARLQAPKEQALSASLLDSLLGRF
jgi:hypothetical protein